MLNLKALMINTENPKVLVEFYTKILGDPGWEGGEFVGWAAGDGWLMVGPHDQVKGKNSMPGRLIWNFETSDVQAEFDRIKNLGAKVQQEPYHPGEDSNMTLATFEDPDGNYFQLATPM